MIEQLKDEVADLVLDSLKRRQLEAAKRRRRIELEEDQRRLNAMRTEKKNSVVIQYD